jgi:hypothetical protein
MRALGLGTALLLLLTGSPAYAAVTEFVSNGDFTTNGGNGQLGFNTTAAGWTVPSPPGSYFFLFNPQSGTTSGTSADNSGAVGFFGSLKLWGPGTGSNNGLTLSPNGSAFIGADPAFENGAISQTLTGLTVGKALTVTFDYAGAQQFNRSGATSEGWAVSLGGATQDTALLSNASEGFTGWHTASFTFTPTSSSEVLSFLSIGSGAVPLPPFALLDSVSATQATIPELSTWAMMALGFAGLGYASFRSNRRKPAAIA